MDRAKRGSCPQYNPPLAVEGDTPQQVVVLQFLNTCRWINCCNCDRKMHVLAKFIIVLEITVQWYAPVCTFLLRLLLLLYRCRCSGTGLGQPPALVLPSSTRVAVVANHRHSGLQSGGGLQSGSSEEEGATSWLQAAPWASMSLASLACATVCGFKIHAKFRLLCRSLWFCSQHFCCGLQVSVSCFSFHAVFRRRESMRSLLTLRSLLT